MQTEARITKVLTDDVRRSPWKGNENSLAGHCYVASEAFYHLSGGKAAGWTPVRIHHEGTTHWFVRHKDGRIVDITSSQFKTRVPHESGVGAGFLTKSPSKRAQIVIDRVMSQ